MTDKAAKKIICQLLRTRPAVGVYDAVAHTGLSTNDAWQIFLELSIAGECQRVRGATCPIWRAIR